jgi:hypothetical protein
MKTVNFQPRPMDELERTDDGPPTEWIWYGMLARGNITLLTSLWKAGKTTLLAGLLKAMYAGDEFIGRNCLPSWAIVVSEESAAIWTARREYISIGVNASLVSRPFVGRPTAEQWDELVRHAEAIRAQDRLDLLVVDPLVAFLPGRSDSDPAALLDMLRPLRRLADAGVAILILHHPRKEPSDEGSTARGSGALLGYVDIILELSRSGRLLGDSNRRRIVGFSRHPETPESLVYEWDRDRTGEFRLVPDLIRTRFEENWPILEAMLKRRGSAATHKDLLADWPQGKEAPGASLLYDWLSHATEKELVTRTGAGTKCSPYYFKLPSQPTDPTDLELLDPGLGGMPPFRPRSKAMSDNVDLAGMSLSQLARHFLPASKEDFDDMPPRGIGPYRKE